MLLATNTWGKVKQAISFLNCSVEVKKFEVARLNALFTFSLAPSLSMSLHQSLIPHICAWSVCSSPVCSAACKRWALIGMDNAVWGRKAANYRALVS